MSTTTHDEAIDALGPFAELPDWLAALMLPGRLESSLRGPETRLVSLELREAGWAIAGGAPVPLEAVETLRAALTAALGSSAPGRYAHAHAAMSGCRRAA